MNAQTPMHRMPAAGRPAPDSQREGDITSVTALITNLLRCILWLLSRGVYVTGFTGRRHGSGAHVVTVRVEASPTLHRMCADAIWLKQIRSGCHLTHTWQAMRFGIRVEWEEVVGIGQVSHQAGGR